MGVNEIISDTFRATDYLGNLGYYYNNFTNIEYKLYLGIKYDNYN